MSKSIAGSPDYTPAEDINDVLQLIVLIKDRPCINPRGTGINRACAIAYAELEVMRKRLTHAVEKLQAERETEHAQTINAREDVEPGEYPRPMGATPKRSARHLTPIEKRIVEKLIARPGMTASQLASELNFNPTKMLEILALLQGLGVITSNIVNAGTEDVYTNWFMVSDFARRTLTRDDLPKGWTVEYVNMPGVGHGYDLKENGATRGAYPTLQRAVQAALELSAP